MHQTHHTVVIGAGIAGCAAAWLLKRYGCEVLLVDRAQKPAAGGSGAAGAFVSPKIGKGGALQQLTNEAFAYAYAFYREHFPDYFHQTGVVRIPKNSDDAQKFPLYASHNYTPYRLLNPQQLALMGIKTAFDSFLFDEAGVCDAPELCFAMSKPVAFRQLEVERIMYKDDHWFVYGRDKTAIQAKKIVLATGHENDLLDMRYMGVRGTWGSRGDYKSDAPVTISMHKKISVSANIDGIVKLGATHVKSDEPCLVCDGKPLEALEKQAAATVDTSDFKLKQIFCGMRAGSKDYFPLVGKIVDVAWMLAHHPAIVRGKKVPLRYLPDIYVLNGLGGRGFVFAPLMAKQLAELILKGIPVDERINPDRLFWRWVRRL